MTVKKLLIDNALPDVENAFPTHFVVESYKFMPTTTQLQSNDILVCRSSLKVNQNLLANSTITMVATASSGSDNLDKRWLTSEQIQWFDAKGCNAVSVSDYTLSCIAWLELKNLLTGNQVAIIGVGHVGSKNAERLSALGFECLVYDPPRQLIEPNFNSATLEAVYQADIILLNCNYHQDEPHSTDRLVNDAFLDNLKVNSVIINTARGDVVDETAIIANAHKIHYLTDVFQNEPHVNKDIIAMASICTPHIAGHSRDAKYKAIHLVSEKIHKQLGFTPPRYTSAPFRPVLKPIKDDAWQKQCLHFYNPIQETKVLKNSHNLTETFTESRAAHQIRHDFVRYES